MTTMDKATIAIIISMGSLLVAGLSLGWTIYRDFAMKPRVKVSFGMRMLFHNALPKPVPKIVISVTNLGPGTVTFGMIRIRNVTLWRRLTGTTQQGLIFYDSATEPMSAKLPATVQPGDRIDLLLPWNEQCCMSEPCTDIGILDYFDRVHWAPRADVKVTREQWLKDFAEKGNLTTI
jgi:hypothetical protein